MINLSSNNTDLIVPNSEIQVYTEPKPDSSYDMVILLTILLLVGIGLVMVYSASSAIALERYKNSYFYLRKQFIAFLLGCLAMIICKNIPFRIYNKLAYPALLGAVIFLILVFIPGIGHTVSGATRWLRIFGLSFQPSEFARLSLIVYLSYSISKKQRKIQEFSIGFLPHAFVVGFFMFLIALQPDFGSVVIMAVLAVFMLYVGGVRFIHLFTCVLAMLPAAYYLIINAPYRLKRIMTFLNPWEYQLDAGYQIIHSLMAFGSGGIWGQGIGKSYQKLFYLPEPHTDFIFSVIGEELGLLGIFAIVALYVVLILRGLYVAKETNDMFGVYLAFGFTTAVALQVCVNLSVTLGLLPTKGLTLPFISYGGTSLVLNLAAIGILLNIASYRKQEKESN